MTTIKAEISGFPQRLRLARTRLELSQSDFAIRSDVGGSTYQKYELGTSKPGCEAMEGFANLGINCNWLLTGEGEMLLSSGDQPNLNVDMGLLKVVINACKRSLGNDFIKLNMDDQLNFATNLYLQIEKVMLTLGVSTKDKDALNIDEKLGLVIKLNQAKSNSTSTDKDKQVEKPKVKPIYDKNFDF